MPRFSITKYDPREDSTEGYQEDGLLVLASVPGGCPCGCLGKPKGGKSVFRMGHDARLRGKLIRAHLTQTQIKTVKLEADGDVPGPVIGAKLYSQRFGWAPSLEAAELRREGKNRQVMRKALGSRRLIKVGRWEYTGQVVAIYQTTKGDQFDVEYVTKQGEVKKRRVPADEAPLARAGSAS